MKRVRLVFLCLILLAAAWPGVAETLGKWLGQTVYVPIYSHIYGEDRYRDTPFLLTATLSVRNTDPGTPFTLKKVSYYDSKGTLLKQYLDKPQVIEPLGSIRFIVPESETKGGSGAKFIVEWEAEAPVIEPIIESVMIGTKMQQGISFISTGRVIKGIPAR